MVDVLQNYMQEAISVVRLPRRVRDLDEDEDDERPTAFGLHRNVTERQRLRQEVKEQDKRNAEQQLYQVKESTLPSLDLPVKSVSNLSCRYCKPKKQVNSNENFFISNVSKCFHGIF